MHRTVLDSAYRYTAYGLTVEASLPLPELPVSDAQDEVRRDVSFVRVPLGTPPVPGSIPCSPQNQGEQVVIVWGDYLTLRLRHGCTCAFDTSDALSDDMLRRYLLGPGLGILLHQRGLLVLHASAVNVEGEAVLFIGEKGAGKSTTAAALLARGHTLLSDDVVAIDTSSPEHPRVLPAFPQLRLWPDSAAAANVPDDELVAYNPRLAKRSWDVDGRFHGQPVPLREINLLGRGTPGDVHDLSGNEAFGALLPHLYAPRFAGASVITQKHLEACTSLLRRIPVRRLMRSESIDDLPCLVRVVEDS